MLRVDHSNEQARRSVIESREAEYILSKEAQWLKKFTKLGKKYGGGATDSAGPDETIIQFKAHKNKIQTEKTEKRPSFIRSYI